VTAGSVEHVSGGGLNGEGVLQLTAAAIAEAVGGRLVGDPSVVVGGVAPLDRASPKDLSFLGVAKYASQFTASRAGVVLVSPELAETPGQVGTRIVVDRPQEALLALLPRFQRVDTPAPGVHPTAIIGSGVRLGRNASVGPYAVLGDGARLGDGAVVGAHCVIGAGVEIGANTTIDRGSIDDTVVGAGTKIDNLVQIAHNVRIGRACLIMAQVGIAGSVRVEDGAMLLGQVGVSGHHTVGKGARLAAQAGVFGDIPAGETWSGYPARPHKEALRAQAALFKLPALWRRIERLLEEK